MALFDIPWIISFSRQLKTGRWPTRYAPLQPLQMHSSFCSNLIHAKLCRTRCCEQQHYSKHYHIFSWGWPNLAKSTVCLLLCLLDDVLSWRFDNTMAMELPWKQLAWILLFTMTRGAGMFCASSLMKNCMMPPMPPTPSRRIHDDSNHHVKYKKCEPPSKLLRCLLISNFDESPIFLQRFRIRDQLNVTFKEVTFTTDHFWLFLPFIYLTSHVAASKLMIWLLHCKFFQLYMAL